MTVFSVANPVNEQQEAPVREGRSKARAPWEGMQKKGVPPPDLQICPICMLRLRVPDPLRADVGTVVAKPCALCPPFCPASAPTLQAIQSFLSSLAQVLTTPVIRSFGSSINPSREGLWRP